MTERRGRSEERDPGAPGRPRATVGNALRLSRGKRISIRELARRSGISAGQVSRIEGGEVERPSAETLVALARALDANPIPLLILSGHIEEKEARTRLRHFLARDAELAEEWASFDSAESVARARAVVDDPGSKPADLRRVAFDVFMTAETEETLWHDAYLALESAGHDASELRELIAAWPTINTERRRYLLQFARDQVALSRAEFAEETAREEQA
jgi:transcriptional regulator with XRE-family HTH domain